jgi:hypothetical protein
MRSVLTLLLVAAIPALGQTLVPRLPVSDAKQLIDNERVTVWDVTVPRERALTMIERHPNDMIGIDLVDARFSVGFSDATGTTTIRGAARAGQVFFSKGETGNATERFLASNGDTLRRLILIELKNTRVEPLKNASGFPNAFPRDRAERLLENDRVIIWDYAWELGKATPMHFHTLDTVTVAMENGEVRSTTADGKSTVNTNTFGLARFNPRARTHTEELIKGAARAIIVELK